MLAESLLACYELSVASGKPLALRVFISGRGRLEDEGATALAQAFKVSLNCLLTLHFTISTFYPSHFPRFCPVSHSLTFSSVSIHLLLNPSHSLSSSYFPFHPFLSLLISLSLSPLIFLPHSLSIDLHLPAPLFNILPYCPHFPMLLLIDFILSRCFCQVVNFLYCLEIRYFDKLLF